MFSSALPRLTVLRPNQSVPLSASSTPPSHCSSRATPKDRRALFNKAKGLPSCFCIADSHLKFDTPFKDFTFSLLFFCSLWAKKEPCCRPISGSRNNYFANRQGSKVPGSVFLHILVVSARGQRKEQKQGESARRFFSPKQTPRGHGARAYQQS